MLSNSSPSYCNTRRIDPPIQQTTSPNFQKLRIRRRTKKHDLEKQNAKMENIYLLLQCRNSPEATIIPA